MQDDATRLTVGKAGHIMAIHNNIVIGHALQYGFCNLARAQRLFDAQPVQATKLIISNETSSL